MAVERLGPYRIANQLGQGGMGTVYAAVNEQTGQPAAVKVLSTLLAGQENFRARFESEIETLKRLKHPTIVQLVGFGEQEGHLFYAMELIDGTSLQDELRAGRRFSWQEVIRFGIAICAALKLAHDSGVIHRDLKPANLMLTRDGQIKLMDFGIARLFGATQLTADGGVVGTIDYMSPEQAEAQPVTARSDLYSLGAVMYALLTGRPPFIGKSLAKIVHALRYDAHLPVQRLAPDVPDELCLVIDQLLEKDPKKRIPTALILGNRLKAIEHGLTRQATSPEASPTNSAADDEYRLADDAGAEGVPDGRTRTVAGKDLATRLVPMDPQPKDGAPATEVASSRPAGQSPQIPGPDLTQVASPNAGPSQLANLPGPDTRNHKTLADAPQMSAVSMSRFTTIDEDEKRRVRRQREEVAETHRLAWLRVAIIVFVVLMISVGLWMLKRPASADSLYQQLSALAQASDPDQLDAAEAELDTFLDHYPDDPRVEEVREWKDQVVSHREARKLARRARMADKTDDLTVAERLYADASQLALNDPEHALAKMRALVDLLGDQEQPDAATERAVTLARQQIPRLANAIAKQNSADRDVVAKRLDWADAQTDRQAAQRVYQSVVTLLADKPWASDLVERARQALAKAERE